MNTQLKSHSNEPNPFLDQMKASGQVVGHAVTQELSTLRKVAHDSLAPPGPQVQESADLRSSLANGLDVAKVKVETFDREQFTQRVRNMLSSSLAPWSVIAGVSALLLPKPVVALGVAALVLSHHSNQA